MALNMLECLGSSLPVGEKFKRLNLISKQLTSVQVDEALEALKTNPNYDQIRIKLADDFKRYSCVLDILENGNKQSISRAVKLPWMYADGSELINAEFLVTSLFPRVSFSTRSKIINNLGSRVRNTQLADHIFNTIESKYGFETACSMLHACSEEVILNCLGDERSYELSPTQLLSLVKTSPHVGLKYLKEIYVNLEDINKDYSSSLKYLVDHHTSEMIPLLLKHSNKWLCELGCRRSKKLLTLYSEELEEFVSENRESIKHCQIRKMLSPQQYEKVFLKNVTDWDLMNLYHFYCIPTTENFWKWLDPLPKSRQLTIVRNAFRKAFNKEIIQCPLHVSPDILVLLPYKERIAIIDWKVEHDNGYVSCRNFNSIECVYSNLDRFWIALKPTSSSIPELTKILNSERECRKRADLFKYLVMSCFYNKDAQELTFVFQLLTKRCRNDQPEVRQAFLEVMADLASHIEFREDHWACFQELLQFLQLYKEIDSSNTPVIVNLLGKYCVYLLNCKMACDSELRMIIKMSVDSEFSFDISYVKNPHIKREMIDSYIRVLSVEAEDSIWHEHRNYIISLIKEISIWNQHRQNLPINVSNYRWLEKRCWEIMTEQEIDGIEFDVDQRIYAFKVLKRSSNFNPDDFDKMLSNEICASALHLCLKFHPEKIMDNVENVVLNILKVSKMREFRPYFLFIKKLRSTYCWGLLDQVKVECKKIMNHADRESVATYIGNAIRLLAVLESSEFLNLAMKHYPVKAKIDTSIPIDEVDYRIKESITESLKHLLDAKLYLPVIDRYLIGDYLKLTVPSLYSVCLATPEKEALVYLYSGLKDHSVSMKNHTIHLFFLISPLDKKCKVLEEMWSSEKNPFLKYEILTQIYRLFKTLPRAEVWTLLKSSIESLTEEDIPSLNFVNTSITLDKCLGEYSSEFFQMILEIFKRTGVYKKSERQVITRISNVVSKLDGNFLDSFIQAVFHEPRLFTNDACSQLAVHYLMDESISTEVRIHRLNLLQNVIKYLFDHHWNITGPDYDVTLCKVAFPTRRLLSQICFSMCWFLLDSPGKDKAENGKEVLPQLIKLFKGVADASRTFKSFVYMQLTLVALDNIELKDLDRLKIFGQEVAPYLSLLAEEYGGETVFITSAILSHVCKKMLGNMDEENIIRIIDGLLSNKEICKYHLITAVFLFQKVNTKSDELSQIQKRVAGIIKNCSDITAEIYYKLKEDNDDWNELIT